MRRKTHAKQKRSYNTINELMGRGLLTILKEKGPEPAVNKWRLGLRSGVSYKVIKYHCRGGFITRNVINIVEEFRNIIQSYTSPEILAVKIMACIKQFSTWFSIEEARKSYLLWEMLANELKADLTSHWIHLSEHIETERYYIFWLKLYNIVSELERNSFSDEAMLEAELRLQNLLRICASASMGGLIAC